MTQLEHFRDDDGIHGEIMNVEEQFQPELHDFYVTDIPR